MWSPKRKKLEVPSAAEALPGRATRMTVPAAHFVNGNRLEPPFPAGLRTATFGLGCFWGAEKRFWNLPGVYSTSVGYTGGSTPNPTYEEVCTGLTGHNEVVRVVYDPRQASYEELLRVFWETHDPTQGMRQGNDIGTQYRSGIYFADDTERRLAEGSRARYKHSSRRRGMAPLRQRYCRRPSSITPRTTTSSTWPRIRPDTVG